MKQVIGFPILFLFSATLFAANIKINEIMAGYNGSSHSQFVEILVLSDADKNWKGTNGNPGKFMLTAYDLNGIRSGRFVLDKSPLGGSATILLATNEFSKLHEITPLDIQIPPIISANSGKLCIESNPDNLNVKQFQHCVSYGNYVPVEPETPHVTSLLPIMNAKSISRIGNFEFDNTTDVDLNLQLTSPTPAGTSSNNTIEVQQNQSSGGSHIFTENSLVDQGKTLFEEETFNGNGRTCKTCHIPPFLDMKPAHIKQKPTNDPLFVGDMNNNVNRLMVTSNSPSGFSKPSDLRGTIRDELGSTAAILHGTGDTYLITGGSDLQGAIHDNFGNSANVVNFTAGDLNGANPINGSQNGLEDSTGNMLRRSNSELFPDGRALVLENINGFQNPEVFRSSPGLINLDSKFQFGWSGEFFSLNDFTLGAVKQHLPRSLAREENSDFRIPTTEEINALVAFQQLKKLNVGNLDGFGSSPTANSRTRTQRNGWGKFLNFCTTCHSDQHLGSPLRVNTGVANLPINTLDELPIESASPASIVNNRSFLVPQLMEIRNTAPYFHNNAANSLEEAVAFYNTSEFKSSGAAPFAGILSSPSFQMSQQEIDELVSFLKTLTEYPFTFTRFIHYDELQIGNEKSEAIEITNSGTKPLTLRSLSLKMGDTQFSSLREGANGEFLRLNLGISFDPFVFDQFTFPDNLDGTTIAPGETFNFDLTYRPTISGPLRTALLHLDFTDGTDSWNTAITLTGKPIGDDTTPPILFKELRNARTLPDPFEAPNEFILPDLIVDFIGEQTFATPDMFFQSDFLDNGIDPRNITLTKDFPIDNRFSLGLSTVSTTASDIAGNKLIVKQKVFVVDGTDTLPPVFKAIENVEIESLTFPVEIELQVPTVSDLFGIKSLSNDAPINFPEGETIVTWTAIDNFDNKAEATQKITVSLLDIVGPKLTPVDNISAEASGMLTLVKITPPEAKDSSGVKSISNNAPQAFPLGKTEITWTATDMKGNVSSTIQTVTISDTTGPLFNGVQDTIILEAMALLTPANITAPAVTDNIGIKSLKSNAPDTFPLGDTEINWTAVDLNDNQSNFKQTIRVIDIVAPTITKINDINIVASSALNQVDLGEPLVEDAVGVEMVMSNAPELFPIGNTKVIWIAKDLSGNTNIQIQNVSVEDNEAPTIHNIEDLRIETTKNEIEVDLSVVFATDNIALDSISNDAPETFPIGETEVLWIANDTYGNKTQVIQKVLVIDEEAPQKTSSTTLDEDKKTSKGSMDSIILVLLILANFIFRLTKFRYKRSFYK